MALNDVLNVMMIVMDVLLKSHDVYHAKLTELQLSLMRMERKLVAFNVLQECEI